MVVNDQSTDRTAEIVRGLATKYSRVKMIEVAELPAGWVGKNYAVWLGAREAKGEWLLFTDADAVHEKHAAARAVRNCSGAGSCAGFVFARADHGEVV